PARTIRLSCALHVLFTHRRLSGDRRHDLSIAESYRRQGKPARALDLIGELRREDVPRRVWIDAQIARARALADTERTDTALILLTEAARDATGTDRGRASEQVR